MPGGHKFSPAFIYNQIKQGSCTGGSYITDALNILELQGVLSLEKFGYDERECGRAPTDAQIQSAWEYRIARWMRVNVQSLAEMKAQIARGFPVIIGMNVYQSFMDWRGGGVYTRTVANAGAPRGGHAMLVVGYADQLRAFKVLNLGTGWGDSGYAWIAYPTFQAMTQEGYVTVDIFMQHFAPTVSTPPAAPPIAQAPPAVELLHTGKTPPHQDGRYSGDTQKDTVLTTEMLGQAVRSTMKPKVLFNWEGLDVVPYSVWLDLPRRMTDTIMRVEYWFDHPSFVNPKRSEAGSNIFIANWRGYGCIRTARAKAFLKSGGVVEAPFDLCEVQGKF